MLDLKALGCRDPRSFPFLTPPPPSHMTAALLDLALLGGTRPSLPYLMAAEETTKTISASSSAAAAAAMAPDGSSSAIIRAASCSSEVKTTPPPPFDVLAALSADAAVAPLTPLGKLMADLPVEPPVRY